MTQNSFIGIYISFYEFVKWCWLASGLDQRHGAGLWSKGTRNVAELYSEQDFKDLQQHMRTLEPGAFIFVQADLRPRHLKILDADEKFFVIVARANNRASDGFYCICRVADFQAARIAVRAVITEMGGGNIVEQQMH
jgi:hypothetical protein